MYIYTYTPIISIICVYIYIYIHVYTTRAARLRVLHGDLTTISPTMFSEQQLDVV